MTSIGTVERAGFFVVSCFTHDIRDGRLDFEAFMRTHTPDVIAYVIVQAIKDASRARPTR